MSLHRLPSVRRRQSLVPGLEVRVRPQQLLRLLGARHLVQQRHEEAVGQRQPLPRQVPGRRQPPIQDGQRLAQALHGLLDDGLVAHAAAEARAPAALAEEVAQLRGDGVGLHADPLLHQRALAQVGGGEAGEKGGVEVVEVAGDGARLEEGEVGGEEGGHLAEGVGGQVLGGALHPVHGDRGVGDVLEVEDEQRQLGVGRGRLQDHAQGGSGHGEDGEYVGGRAEVETVRNRGSFGGARESIRCGGRGTVGM